MHEECKLRCVTNLRLFYGYEHVYTYDYTAHEWIRDDKLVSFNTKDIIKLIIKKRLIIKELSMPNHTEEKDLELLRSIVDTGNK